MRIPYTTKNEPRVEELASQLQNVIDNIKGMKGVIEYLNDPDTLYYVCLSVTVKPVEEGTKRKDYPSFYMESQSSITVEFIKDQIEDNLHYDIEKHSELLKQINEVAGDGIS